MARSAFLPSINLSAPAGYQSDSLSSLINPANALYSLGASLAATIFNHGRLSAQYDIALAARKALVIRYKEAALTAFLEVATALTANSLLVKLEKHRERSAAENNEAYRVGIARYTSGAEDFLAVLDAQDTLVSAENSLIQTRLERLNSAVSLFKYLGGGWGERGSLAEVSYKRQRYIRHHKKPAAPSASGMTASRAALGKAAGGNRRIGGLKKPHKACLNSPALLFPPVSTK